MQKIIIVGYPKSGTTYMSRLTAELVDCPVEGFLYNSKHNEIAIEGKNRKSNFGVYKAHQQLNELKEEDINNAKIIYVVRDPRDVALSGRHFFTANLISKNRNNFFINKINKWSRKIFKLQIQRIKINQLVLYGNGAVHHWCKVPWKKHWKPYFEREDVLKIKYEDILQFPLEETKKILDFIGIERSESERLKAIENQSFAKVKKKFTKENDPRKLKLLRKGKMAQWKSNFSEKEKRLFTKELREELMAWSYEL